MSDALTLAGDNGKISLIEFALKENVDGEEVISHIAQLLPRGAKLSEPNS